MQSEFHNTTDYVQNSNTASWNVWYNEYAGFEALILLYLELWFYILDNGDSIVNRIVYSSFEKYILIINFSF